MTGLLWIAFGMGVSACLLHAALGLRRPIEWKHVSFALLMANHCPYVLLEKTFYHARTVEEAVTLTRAQVFVALLFLTVFVWFIRLYSRERISRLAIGLFGAGILALFVFNCVLPYSLSYSGPQPPKLITVRSFGGEPINFLDDEQMGLPTALYTLFYLAVFAGGIARGVKMFLRGQRRPGAMLAIASSTIFITASIDFVRDNIGGSWPYTIELSGVVMGIIMAVELAIEFRANDDALASALAQVERQLERLARMLSASSALESDLKAELETLANGLGQLAARSPRDEAQLARLRRALARLTELERSMDSGAPSLRATSAVG
jgi:hypothetical protein